MVELAAHNSQAVGSNPAGPTSIAIVNHGKTEAESFFLTCIASGEITLTACGIITHVSTGHSQWATGSGGYPKMSKLDKKCRVIRHIQCHRLMWLHFKGVIPLNLEVNHIDGNKQNYRLKNLELLTSVGNMKHAHETGLTNPASGVKNGYSKFTEDDVSVIKALYKIGYSRTNIARMFGVSYPTVNDVVRGRRYTDIPANGDEKYIKSYVAAHIKKQNTNFS